MADTTERLVQAVLRVDFNAFYQKVFTTLRSGEPFAPNWHLQHIAHKLEDVRQGHSTRLIVNVPPRSGKSILASVAWPLFVIGHEPTTEFLAISHTAPLARDFSLMRRTIVEQPWYQALFPDARWKARTTMDLRTTAGGRIYAAGAGAAVLGKGAGIILIDDPQDGSAAFSEVERRKFNEYYDNTLSTRLNNKQSGAVVMIQQRLHEDDATAHLQSKDEFEWVCLPAIATETSVHALSTAPGHVYRRLDGEVLDPTREPMEVLERMRHIQGAMHFQAQYQQDPVPASGNAIKREWLSYYAQAPATLDRKIVSWDTASTLRDSSDYSVGTVWGMKGLDFYLLDLVRGRFEAPDLRRQIIALHQRWQADLTIIEDTELGRAITQEMRSSQEFRPVLSSCENRDKESRLLAQSARFETRQVHLPREASWLGEYERELLAFPNGRHDDQVDSTSQALRYLTGAAARITPRASPNPPRVQGSLPRPSGAPQRR